MKIVKSNLKAFLIAVAVCCVAGNIFAAVDVKLHDRVVPRGAVVRLGDVAEIGTADRQQARQLSSLPLMPAPVTGTERFLRVREIQDMLAAQGVEIGMLRFCGAERVELVPSATRQDSTNVVRASAETSFSAQVPPMNRHAAILAGAPGKAVVTKPTAPTLDSTRAAEIQSQIKSMIADYLNGKSGKVQQWTIECDLADRELAKLALAQSSPTCLGGSEPWTGRQRFLVSFMTAEGRVEVPLVAEVTPPPIAAIVSIRPISRGEVVKAADIELRMIAASQKSAGQRALADSIEKLIGMEARQMIQVGDIVYTDSVQAPLMVRRGDRVTVTSQSGGIRVRTSGRAMHDAAQGELVQIEAPGSREKYDARVTGRREAAIYSLSRPAASEEPKRTNIAHRPTQLNLTPSR